MSIHQRTSASAPIREHPARASVLLSLAIALTAGAAAPIALFVRRVRRIESAYRVRPLRDPLVRFSEPVLPLIRSCNGAVLTRAQDIGTGAFRETTRYRALALLPARGVGRVLPARTLVSALLLGASVTTWVTLAL